MLANVREKWTTWRGRAVEPVIREALWRRAEDLLPAGTDVVGGYWTRTNDPEIDLIGADRSPIAKKVTFAGSIKWLEQKKFDTHDLAQLVAHRAKLPGADDDTPLVAVARAGCDIPGLTTIGPDDMIDAWTSGL